MIDRVTDDVDEFKRVAMQMMNAAYCEAAFAMNRRKCWQIESVRDLLKTIRRPRCRT